MKRRKRNIEDQNFATNAGRQTNRKQLNVRYAEVQNLTTRVDINDS